MYFFAEILNFIIIVFTLSTDRYIVIIVSKKYFNFDLIYFILITF